MMLGTGELNDGASEQNHSRKMAWHFHNAGFIAARPSTPPVLSERQRR